MEVRVVGDELAGRDVARLREVDGGVGREHAEESVVLDLSEVDEAQDESEGDDRAQGQPVAPGHRPLGAF